MSPPLQTTGQRQGIDPWHLRMVVIGSNQHKYLAETISNMGFQVFQRHPPTTHMHNCRGFLQHLAAHVENHFLQLWSVSLFFLFVDCEANWVKKINKWPASDSDGENHLIVRLRKAINGNYPNPGGVILIPGAVFRKNWLQGAGLEGNWSLLGWGAVIFAKHFGHNNH